MLQPCDYYHTIVVIAALANIDSLRESGLSRVKFAGRARSKIKI
jgi:hypothetical protein